MFKINVYLKQYSVQKHVLNINVLNVTTVEKIVYFFVTKITFLIYICEIA